MDNNIQSHTPSALNIKFWGTRGSRTVAASDFLKYGGYTSCVEVDIGKTVLVFDAGSGFTNFSSDFQKRVEAESVNPELHMFQSHWHIDHIIGLEQASIMFDPKIDKTLHASEFTLTADQVTLKRGAAELHNTLFQRPYSPGLGALHCLVGGLKFQDHELGKSVEIESEGGLVRITPLPIPHGRELSVGFRIDAGDTSACILTDFSPNFEAKTFGSVHQNLIDNIRGTDLLIADSMYDDAEFEKMPFLKTFGHASRQEITAYAEKADIEHIYHTHHNPEHNDVVLAAREEINAKEVALKGIEAHFSKEGETISLPLLTRPAFTLKNVAEALYSPAQFVPVE